MITVEVCIGVDCHFKGAYKVVSALEKLVKQNNFTDKVIIKGGFCLGNCTKAVSVTINKEEVYSVQPENVDKFFKEHIQSRIELCSL
ncbi:MAG: (2Fe-2S) ferredoxin domain-containing protein [Epulopiscium sp.]|nr:(2Fe-2S) ferredoxin domain-containing protein [Candidatus Epulonipiscium sp.]